MNLWPHQERALKEIHDSLFNEKRICVTAPTGAGKSLMMRCLLEWCVENQLRAVLYTNRKLLREQLSAGLNAAGIDHGVRAAGHALDCWQGIQVSSIQTEDRRVFKTGAWELHDANIVLVDEAHMHKSGVSVKIIDAHVADGATVIGWTATPLEVGHVYKRLISAGKNSELRKCGAHVPCLTYAPDEPDLRNIGPVKVGEDLTESQNVKAIMRPGIFGRAYKHWCEINKDARPTILFGPDVGGSLYFAEQFHNKGVSAAHIDAKYVWINGQQYPTTQELRDEVIAGVKCGDIKVICNRFVLREGIDIPELYCGILASVFGSLSTYLQASGRLLRSHKSLDQVVLIDHGGNYWRHGSVNADREWHLSDTNRILAERRMEALREKKEAEPITCPQCSKVRASGPKCHECGFQHQKKSRMVVQASGRLVPRYGDIVKPRVTEKRNDTEEKWKQMYHRAKRSKNGMTFKQAWGLFYKENGYFPPRNLPEMPKDELTWSRKVRDVRYVELNASLNDPVIG